MSFAYCRSVTALIVVIRRLSQACTSIRPFLGVLSVIAI
jgi:hypothetical protein